MRALAPFTQQMWEKCSNRNEIKAKKKGWSEYNDEQTNEKPKQIETKQINWSGW